MTLVQENGDDTAKSLVTDGLVIVEKRKEKRLQKLMEEYYRAQDGARKARVSHKIYRFHMPPFQYCNFHRFPSLHSSTDLFILSSVHPLVRRVGRLK